MKTHNWITEVCDGGHVGLYDFTYCIDCGAYAGSNNILSGIIKKEFPPFINTDIGHLYLPHDCDLSKEMVLQYEKCRENKHRASPANSSICIDCGATSYIRENFRNDT